MALRLFVGNLSFKTTEGELEPLFAESGSVSSVAIIMDRFSGRSRGFGFIEMGSEEEAQAQFDEFVFVYDRTTSLKSMWFLHPVSKP